MAAGGCTFCCTPRRPLPWLTGVSRVVLSSPRVPESLLKKRKQQGALAVKKAADAAVAKKTAAAARKTIFKRAEAYVKEYRATEREQIRLKRQARKAGNFYVEPEAKLALVIRIRGCAARALFSFSALSISLFLPVFALTIRLAVSTACRRRCARCCSSSACSRSTTPSLCA
jgi:hypothetical protein